MNLSDWKQAAQRSAATEKLQLVIAQRSAALHSAAQPSAAQRSVCVNGPLKWATSRPNKFVNEICLAIVMSSLVAYLSTVYTDIFLRNVLKKWAIQQV